MISRLSPFWSRKLPTALELVSQNGMKLSDEPSMSFTGYIWLITGQLVSGNLTELGLLLGGKSVAGFSEDAVWEYVGRNFCILYWLFLADFGQTAVSNPLFGTVTQPAVSKTTANIFVDQVL